MALSRKRSFAKLFLKLLHETIVQKLSYEVISSTFAWHCHAKAALRSSSLSFCLQLSCKSCLWELFLKLLHGTVVQTLPFEAIPRAFQRVWNCNAKFALQIYLSRKNIGQHFHHAPMCFWIMAEVLGAAWAVLGAFESVCSWCCMELSCISCLQSYLLSFCMELSCKSCLTKLFLELLLATVVQKLPCKTTS